MTPRIAPLRVWRVPATSTDAAANHSPLWFADRVRASSASSAPLSGNRPIPPVIRRSSRPTGRSDRRLRRSPARAPEVIVCGRTACAAA